MRKKSKKAIEIEIKVYKKGTLLFFYISMTYGYKLVTILSPPVLGVAWESRRCYRFVTFL